MVNVLGVYEADIRNADRRWFDILGPHAGELPPPDPRLVPADAYNRLAVRGFARLGGARMGADFGGVGGATVDTRVGGTRFGGRIGGRISGGVGGARFDARAGARVRGPSFGARVGGVRYEYGGATGIGRAGVDVGGMGGVSAGIYDVRQVGGK